MDKHLLSQRFWKKVYKTQNCWFWIGGLWHGYGKMTFEKKQLLASHVSWFLANRKWPFPKWVLHTCDTPQCVRPDHLFLGTHADNARDAAFKGCIGKPQGKMKLTPDQRLHYSLAAKERWRKRFEERKRSASKYWWWNRKT